MRHASATCPQPPPADADAERHRLHTAVTDLLVGVSSERPLLVVLEDVHWADASTLGLMRHLVRSGAAARMLIVATFRDDEADVPAELASALVDVYRTEGVVRLRLAGLSEADVAEFVRLTAGAEPDPDLAAAILGLTDGNAFLVTELWRELLDAQRRRHRAGRRPPEPRPPRSSARRRPSARSSTSG